MTDNKDALFVANSLEHNSGAMPCEIHPQDAREAAAHIRRLVAENAALRAANADLALSCRSWNAQVEAKDALLREALVVLGYCTDALEDGHWQETKRQGQATSNRIRAALGET